MNLLNNILNYIDFFVIGRDYHIILFTTFGHYRDIELKNYLITFADEN